MTHRATSAALYSLLPCLLLGSGSAIAREIKCWRGHDNIRECGAVVPPEFSQQRIEVLNEHGIVVRVIPAAKSKEELAEIARRKKLEEQRRLRIAEQKRKDSILLQTYTTERDLELAYKDRTDAIKSIIDITNSNTQSLKKNLARLQKRASNYERSGQQPPKALTIDMENLMRQIRDNDEFIAKKQKTLIELSKQFDADLERYRLLKQGKVKYE